MHASHDVWPLVLANVLGSHSMQSVAAAAPLALPCLPGGHALHLSAASTPVALENVPMVHGMHVALLEALETLLQRPAGQGVQRVFSAFANVPRSQTLHSVPPAVSWYLPPVHGVHASVFVAFATNPGGHN